MAKVIWWLSTKGSDYRSLNLWVREVEMAFLPTEDDMVHILTSAEEDEGSVTGAIKRRYWNFDGTAHLEFQDHVIDPPDNFKPNRIWTSWWTDRDGDFEEMLRACGWVDYHEWTSTRS